MLKNFLNFFQKVLDKHEKTCYNNNIERGVNLKTNLKGVKYMVDKIKELARIVRESGKLLDEIATLIAKLTLVVMAIMSLIQIIKGG